MKTVEGQDDFHSMEETIIRRLNRSLSGDEKFVELPDLMLIDGGAVHASIAEGAVIRAGLHIPVFGMVKDDKHRTRALITPDGMEIGISGNPAVFAFIGNIQEETHRFAIDYHRKLRSKRAKYSALDNIQGVGDKRKAALLKRFGSLAAIKAAKLDDIAKVVDRSTANNIYNYFHGENSGKMEDGSI